MVTFGDFRLIIGVSRCNFVPVHYNSIVVDLSKAVCLFQVVPTDFVVEWDMISFSKSRYSHINVMDSSIIVHKDYVVVEHKDVEDEHSELDHKCHEKSDEA